MYLYFDRYGTLKEQITFNPARVGNSNVNKIFVYWEGVEEFADWAQELALQTRYLLQDNTQYPSATTFGFSAQPETAELPFDKNQDLKYFKYYKEYKFLTIDIPDEVLSYNGAVKSYIWVLNADKKRILGLGVFAFMVDGDINEVIPDENISLAQWNMISAQLGLLSGSVIDVTCDIATNTLKVYYANGLTAIRNLPPNGAQTTISSDFLQEMIFSADTWVQDGENGYYTYFYSMGVGYNDNRFFVQLERDGKYNSDYYNKTGSFVLSDNIFKGSDGSVLLYSNEPYSGRLLVVGGDLLSGDILVTGLTYNDVNSNLVYHTADGITHTIYLGIEQKFDKSNVSQTTGDSQLKVMSQKVVTELLNDKLFKWDVVQSTGDSTDKVMSQKAVTDNFARLVDGKVPESQLPSYVDDVVEYDSKNDFPEPGEEGKIYVDKSTNLTYRWSGSTYIQVGGGDLALENGTGDVLIQTTDPNQSFKVMTDGRAKVQSAPTENDDVVRKLELDKKLTAPTIPTETSFVTVSSTGTSAYKKVSELVDTTSEQTITGTKNFESTGKNFCITCQTIIKGVTYTAKISGGDLLFINDGGSENIQANYGINGVYSRHRTSSSSGLLKLPIDLEGTFAITPNAAPTEPSFIVTAADRTPTWQSAAPILSDYVDDALLGG